MQALTESYRQLLPESGVLLDLMSSWISHLPTDISYSHVSGLGMNQVELNANSQLDHKTVQDLNQTPTLPYPDNTFHAVLKAVSIQYLTRPIEVFSEVARVLKPKGIFVVSTSHRMFPTKAIRAWHILSSTERIKLVTRYFEISGGFSKVEFLDYSPPQPADPLWLVVGTKG